MQHIVIPFRELKMAEPDPANATGGKSFSGYGAAFNNVDSYGDVIAPGAFAKFLSEAMEGKQAWPSMLSQHGGWGMTAEDMTPIGAWTSLAEDGKGLVSAGDLANTQRGIEMGTLMSMKPRPAIDGLSIGYRAIKWDNRSKPEEPRRTLREIMLYEISPVTFPANKNALINSVKSLEDVKSLSEIEDFLREAGGFSRTEVKMIIARIKGADLREADSSEELKAISDLLLKNTKFLKGEL